MTQICNNCKICVHASSWKSKRQIRIECHKREDTSVGCDKFEPRAQLAAAVKSNKLMRSAL